MLGVSTNLGFLRWLLDQPGFRTGDVGTDFVERGVARRAGAAAARRRAPRPRSPPGAPTLARVRRRPGRAVETADGFVLARRLAVPRRGRRRRRRPLAAAGRLAAGADAGHGAAGGRARRPGRGRGPAAGRARGDEDGARRDGPGGGHGARRCYVAPGDQVARGQALVELRRRRERRRHGGRGRAARRPPERGRRSCPTAAKVRADRAARRRRPAGGRGDVVRLARARCPSSPTPRRCCRRAPPPRACATRCWCRTSAASSGRSRPAPTRSPSSPPPPTRSPRPTSA